MNLLRRFCEKVAGADELREEIEHLQTQVRNRDIILKRIKIVATGNHYGYSDEDKAYRDDNCVNYKTRRIFELAREFDKDDKIDYWDELGQLEEE